MAGSNRRQFLGRLATGLISGSVTTALKADPVEQKNRKGGKTPGSNASKDVPSSPPDLGPAEVARKFWIDRRLAALPAWPWRKVHVEFHNSRFVPRIGERFNADEFGDRLLEAHTNCASVFAKDMFGYSYYPSACGPIHPALSFDLLGAQVAALRKRKITVFAYYMTTWNPELAERHPEWLVLDRNRTSSLPKFDETFGCSQQRGTCITASLCLSHEDFVKGELAHLKELVSRYELDGVWIDGSGPPMECYCSECLRQLRGKGLDPLDRRAQHDHKVELHRSFLQRIQQAVKEARPGCRVGPQNEGSYGFGDRTPFIDWTDLEALFTDATWYGYYYAPTVIRYARGFGLPTYGLTTRFKGFWGDFGGLKLPAQLHTELATVVANGSRCDIGDQMHPNARLDPAVYHVIGEVYRRIEQLEPYLEQAVPVTEAALVTSGLPLQSPCTETNFGWVKLLTESRVQFDIVEPTAEWERYALLILPDGLAVDEPTASRLHAFIAGGGAVLVAHTAGLLAGTEKGWLERYGLHFAGLSPFKPAYFVPKINLTGEIPSYEYALYEGASQWRAESPATALALLGEPLFQRSPQHYTSHEQTPFDHTTSYAALARSGRVGLFAFPLGQSYYNQGYWIYRQAFQKLLSELLPAPLMQSDAPLSTELTLTHQAAQPGTGRKTRYLVHIVNFSPVRRTPRHTDFYEDPVPLTNVTVRLNLPLEASTARAVVAGADLPARRVAGGGVEVLVPRVPIHEVINFEAS
jgi:Hypothetical glycosyl hydrolase 6/Beta-galactosidase trimerisation domain